MSAIAVRAWPRAIAQVERKIAIGAPMKITPRVSQTPSTSNAQMIEPMIEKMTAKKPTSFSTTAHVRSVP